MNRAVTWIAAAAVATAVIAPASGRADPLAALERAAAAAEERLAAVERIGAAREEPAAARAARSLQAGRDQLVLGDFLHAAILLADAVDEPAFRGSGDHAEAAFLLAEALRQNGDCSSARTRYGEVLALGATGHRAEAVSGALECAVKERRSGDVEALLADAASVFGTDAPPEVRYLSAKALFHRTDLGTKERIARAAAAFASVAPPYDLQAAYFLGVLRIQEGNLHGSLQWFEACARSGAPDDRRVEVRELCMLALGRVHTQMGNAAAAVDWYAAVPWDSPRFGEALLELAWANVKGERYEQALRMSSFVADVEPGSPLAPEATLLQGHLLLRLGRYGEATEAYNRVINGYAPVRDEIDAVLSVQEDPARWFNEVIAREGRAFDVASVLPPVAAKWASTKREVGAALDLVDALRQSRREVEDAKGVAARIEAVLARGGGLDAFPALHRAYAGAQAVENDAARIEAAALDAAAAAAERSLGGSEALADLRRARAARALLERRMEALPRTVEEADARVARLRARADRADQAAFRAGYLVDSCLAAIAGTEAWADAQRGEIGSDPESRRELAEELRKHREVARGYEDELRALRTEIAIVRDAAAGADAMAEETRIREQYLAALEVEREVLRAARGSLPAQEAAILGRAEALGPRLAAVRARARALEVSIASEAARRAGELLGRVGAERVALAGYGGGLDGVQSVARDLVGRIALRSIEEVRDQFYGIVLKADVGIVDVAWSRKRARLDKIQTLSVQKAAEIDQIDREYRAMLREVD